ncbi:MAG: hypothetical protein HZA25_01750 [Candidatus Niyogibacteria bacterium]|nr:hypothetical protein [Candidatus Niyogibacteria bacterium]
MAHKRLNLKLAKMILGVDFEKLMDLLKMPEAERERLRSRTFLVLNKERLPQINLIMARVNSMRAMLGEARRTFRSDHLRANKWFNSYDIAFTASYGCKCPLDIVRWKGAVGMQMICERLSMVRELGGDQYNPLIPKYKRRTVNALKS